METEDAFAPDSAVLSRATAGDDTAFAEIVRRHLPLVLTVARRRLGNSGHAEDAAQQTFIALSRKLAQRRDIPCLAAWLQKAVVYEAATIARRESRHRRRADAAGALWTEPDPSPVDSGLDRALAALPERDRQILLLHHYEKLPFSSVAQRLGMGEAAAQRRGHRALGKLSRLLRPHGTPRDEQACALWLAGSLVSPGTRVSPDLSRRISALKIAAQPLPWLAISAGFAVLAGGVWATVAVTRSEPPPARPLVAAATLQERPKPVRHEPQITDDKLDPDILTFIAMAKTDSTAAWEWVKKRPEGVEEFLRRKAMRALADRDLLAADRFLAVVEGRGPRQEIVSGIFESRAAVNFESALMWVDPYASERPYVGLTSCSYTNTEWRDLDYAGALDFIQSAKLREWLISQACEKFAALDEAGLPKLAAELKGSERDMVLSQIASLMLQRGDPGAVEVLDEMNGDLEYMPGLDKIALRDPRPLLDRFVGPEDLGAQMLWRQWAMNDAPAALEWLKGSDERKRRAFVSRSMDGTVERLEKKP